MQYSFSEDQIMLRGFVKEFTDSEIRPIAKEIDENEEIPAGLIKKLGEVGLLGTAFPEEYGGGGFGELGFCIAQEEISHACGSTATMIGAHQSIGTNAIFKGGSEELKKKYLPQLTSGEKIASFCLTEPEAGSDSANLKTHAVLCKDKYILNGNKIWITNAGIADVFSVFAKTEKGFSGFVVERDFPGVIIGPNEKKLGIKGSVTNTVSFQDVEVPKENLIGIEGRGFLSAMACLEAGRIGLGACCLGASKEVLRLSVEYSKHRKQFGETISRFQGIQFMLAEIATKIFAMEGMVYRTAQDYDNKKSVGQTSAMVKLFCSEAMMDIADKALQIHGGMGFSRELPLERFYRDARILKIFEGTNEIQKLIISRHVIKDNGKWVF
jgi:alkylation response protein AidB-like acyl-CoA dehydrogenase